MELCSGLSLKKNAPNFVLAKATRISDVYYVMIANGISWNALDVDINIKQGVLLMKIMTSVLQRIVSICPDKALVAAHWLNENTSYAAEITCDGYDLGHFTQKRLWQIREGDMVLFAPERGWCIDDNNAEPVWCESDAFYDEELIEFARDKGYND